MEKKDNQNHCIAQSIYFCFMDKLQPLHKLISTGQIKNLTDLYKRMPRKALAEALQINSVAFTRRANHAGKFRLEEIKLLAEKMDIPFADLLSVFIASL